MWRWRWTREPCLQGHRAVLLRPWAKARALHKHGGDASKAAAAVTRAIDAAVDVEGAYAAGGGTVHSHRARVRSTLRLSV